MDRLTLESHQQKISNRPAACPGGRTDLHASVQFAIPCASIAVKSLGEIERKLPP